MSVRWFVGAAIAVGGALVGFGGHGGSLGLLFEPAQALIVAGPAAAAAFVVAGPRGAANALRALLAPRPTDDLPSASAACLSAAHGATAGGVVATVFGLIRVVNNLSDPADLGPGLASALVGGLYGVGAAGAAVTAAIHFARRSPALPGPDLPSLPGRAVARAGVLGSGGAVAVLAALGGDWLLGGHVSALLQPTAALMTAAPTVGAMVAVGGGGGLSDALTGLVLARDEAALASGSATWLAGAAGATVGGTLAWLLGHAHGFTHLSDPSQLGPGVAVACVGTVYGAVGTATASVLATALARRAEAIAGEAVAGVTLPFALASAGVSALSALTALFAVGYASAA